MIALEARGFISTAIFSLISLLHFSGIHTFNDVILPLLVYHAIPRLVEGPAYPYRETTRLIDPPPRIAHAIPYGPSFCNVTSGFEGTDSLLPPPAFSFATLEYYPPVVPPTRAATPLPKTTHGDIAPYTPRTISFCPVLAMGWYMVILFRAYVALGVAGFIAHWCIEGLPECNLEASVPTENRLRPQHWKTTAPMSAIRTFIARLRTRPIGGPDTEPILPRRSLPLPNSAIALPKIPVIIVTPGEELRSDNRRPHLLNKDRAIRTRVNILPSPENFVNVAPIGESYPRPSVPDHGHRRTVENDRTLASISPSDPLKGSQLDSLVSTKRWRRRNVWVDKPTSSSFAATRDGQEVRAQHSRSATISPGARNDTINRNVWQSPTVARRRLLSDEAGWRVPDLSVVRQSVKLDEARSDLRRDSMGDKNQITISGAKVGDMETSISHTSNRIGRLEIVDCDGVKMVMEENSGRTTEIPVGAIGNPCGDFPRQNAACGASFGFDPATGRELAVDNGAGLSDLPKTTTEEVLGVNNEALETLPRMLPPTGENTLDRQTTPGLAVGTCLSDNEEFSKALRTPLPSSPVAASVTVSTGEDPVIGTGSVPILASPAEKQGTHCAVGEQKEVISVSLPDNDDDDLISALSTPLPASNSGLDNLDPLKDDHVKGDLIFNRTDANFLKAMATRLPEGSDSDEYDTEGEGSGRLAEDESHSQPLEASVAVLPQPSAQGPDIAASTMELKVAQVPLELPTCDTSLPSCHVGFVPMIPFHGSPPAGKAVERNMSTGQQRPKGTQPLSPDYMECISNQGATVCSNFTDSVNMDTGHVQCSALTTKDALDRPRAIAHVWDLPIADHRDISQDRLLSASIHAPSRTLMKPVAPSALGSPRRQRATTVVPMDSRSFEVSSVSYRQISVSMHASRKPIDWAKSSRSTATKETVEHPQRRGRLSTSPPGMFAAWQSIRPISRPEGRLAAKVSGELGHSDSGLAPGKRPDRTSSTTSVTQSHLHQKRMQSGVSDAFYMTPKPTMKRPAFVDRKASATYSLDSTPVIAAIGEQSAKPHNQNISEPRSTAALSNILAASETAQRERDNGAQHGVFMSHLSNAAIYLSAEQTTVMGPTPPTEPPATETSHAYAGRGDFSSNAYLEGNGARKRGRADSGTTDDMDVDDLIASLAGEKPVENTAKRPRTNSVSAARRFLTPTEHRTRECLSR
ncbi:hypothetical protein BV22DRAFT_383695 [Leucogyrophana mollusca]|uniref:Uncharacterized protein n=1 Tax=Leucogyrophana mollusca TaxID=85980 RepID=A0ACB8BJM2_9AGAM|nr:hypothetical protein BV22DRAFT_383695 [Leucogyrophana mollusca]